MDGDAYAGESATLDEFRILDDMPSAVNDHGPPRVKDVVTDADPAEADAPHAEQVAEHTGDRTAEQSPGQAAQQPAERAAQQAAELQPAEQPTGQSAGHVDPQQPPEPAAQHAPQQAAPQATRRAATDLTPDGPRDEPPPPVTGDDFVDAATAEVADTAADPLEARLAAYERAHRTLQDRLADVES